MAANRQPTLGVHLLETITRGMYSEPFHSIREYIQNAYDSIREARRNGLISTDEGAISLNIDETARRVSLRDNGTGLGPEAASVYLLDIGNSEKARSDVDLVKNAGFRGIGRMAGISYCKTLRFETSCGDGRKCVVEFDASGINQLTRRGQKPTTIIEAIDRNSQIREESVDNDNRFLKVTLEGLAPDSPFLNQDVLHRYLALNAPVPFDPGVWSHANKIRSVAEKAGSSSSLEDVKIFICDSDDNVQVDVRRPFKDTFRTTDAKGNKHRTVKVSDVEALPRVGGKGDDWWGWIAVHERQGALADVSFAGLRIRMHNIAVGDDAIIRNLFTTQSQSRWCFGEIHVTDLSLMPNAQRDDFEPSKAWIRLKARLQEEARSLEKEIRKESHERNTSLATLTKRSEEQIESAKDAIEGGFVSYDKKLATIGKLEGLSNKLETQAKQKKRPEIEKAELEKLREQVKQVVEDIKAVRRTGTDDALAHLNKQARNAVRTVFEVLKNDLNEKQFDAVQANIYAALKPGKKNA